MKLSAVTVFALTSLSALFMHVSSAQAANANLGKAQKPLESIGAISAFTENIQKGQKSDLGKLVDENDCERTIVMPDEKPPLEAGDMKVARFTIDISGAGCPVVYHASLEGTQEPEGFSGVIKFNYVAQSAEARALYDIDKMEFAGAFKAKMIQVPNGGGIEFSFDYGGNGNSQTLGAYTSVATFAGKMIFSMGGTPNKTNSAGGMPGLNLKIEGGFDESLKFKFQTESADLSSKTVFAGLIPTGEFKINGTAVPEAEYKKVRDQIKLPGMGENGMGNNSGTASTLECKAEVFRLGNLSTPLQSARSCGGNTRHIGLVNAGEYVTQFTADPSHTAIRVEICAANQACGAIERAFFPDETMSYVDNLLGKYSVKTSCTVVPTCVP